MDAALPGHQKPARIEKEPISFAAHKSKKYDKLFDNLPADKKLFLANESLRYGRPGPPTNEISFSTSSGEQIEKSKADKIRAEKALARETICIRCTDIRGGRAPPIWQPIYNVRSIFNQISYKDTIVNVVDAMDFPMTIPHVDENLNIRKGRVIWVINRCDLLVSDSIKVKQRALPYFRRYLYENYKIDPQDVFAISAKFGWEIDTLYHRLSDRNYLVGYTNAGKSLLSLKLAQKYGLPDSQPEKLDWTASNTMPWSTQAPRVSNLKLDKVLFDMPSMPEAYGGIYGKIRKTYVRRIPYGKRLLKGSNRYNAHRVVAKSTQVINIGGLVAITQETPNPDLTLIAWPILDDAFVKTRITQSVEKVVELASAENPTNDQAKWHFVHPKEAETMEKRIVYAFDGEGISIAIRGLGIVHIHASGKIPEKGIRLAIYTVKDVRCTSRPNILPYLKDSNEEERERVRGFRKHSTKKWWQGTENSGISVNA